MNARCSTLTLIFFEMKIFVMNTVQAIYVYTGFAWVLIVLQGFYTIA